MLHSDSTISHVCTVHLNLLCHCAEHGVEHAGEKNEASRKVVLMQRWDLSLSLILKIFLIFKDFEPSIFL